MTIFCLKCGRLLEVDLSGQQICPKHGRDWKENTHKELRGRFSGKSKTRDKFNED